jgi:dihydrofolate reductase
MGRRTFESLGRPLPGRRNIVLTHSTAYGPEGVAVAHDLEAAFELAGSDDEVFVIGGEQVYRAALPSADRIYLTVIHADIEGDTRFPSLDMKEWELVGEEHHPADDRHDYPFTFRRYERRRTPQ